MSEPCTWPGGHCQCAAKKAEADASPDRQGRVWMHCDSGLTLTKASMGRLMVYCLSNRVEFGDIWPVSPAYPRSQVCIALRLRPDQFEDFEKETGGKLQKPPRISLN